MSNEKLYEVKVTERNSFSLVTKQMSNIIEIQDSRRLLNNDHVSRLDMFLTITLVTIKVS